MEEKNNGSAFNVRRSRNTEWYRATGTRCTWLAGSALKRDFCASATVSSRKPTAHMLHPGPIVTYVTSKFNNYLIMLMFTYVVLLAEWWVPPIRVEYEGG